MLLRFLLSILQLTGIPRLVVALMRDSRVPLGLKMILPVAIVYLIIPFDLFPDFLTVFGRIDDLLVLVVALFTFLVMAPKDVVAGHLGRGRTGPAETRDRRAVIEAEYRFINDSDDKDKEA